VSRENKKLGKTNAKIGKSRDGGDREKKSSGTISMSNHVQVSFDRLLHWDEYCRVGILVSDSVRVTSLGMKLNMDSYTLCLLC